MKKALLVVICSFVIIALYFNIGYLTASSFKNMVEHQCNDATYAFGEKLLSGNGALCPEGKAMVNNTHTLNNAQFAILTAFWPVLWLISLLTWLFQFCWHYVFCGGIFKAIGFV